LSSAATLTGRCSRWADELANLVGPGGVPGAALGVSWRGERWVATAGVANLRSGLPVTDDTVFQLGSISKVYTATLVALLAETERGLFDRPVSEVLAEADWIGPDVTVRHLLTHTSGLGGDHFADTGRDGGCLERYVAGLRDLPRDVPGPPGRRYSYCNSGFAVLGRLVEVMAGKVFDQALRDILLEPLGAATTGVLPEEVILWPVAVGHNRRSPDTAMVPDKTWGFPRSCGPLGGVCAAARDVLALAELHLGVGDGALGVRLEASSLAEMRRRHVELPAHSRPDARGLGWGIYDWSGAELVGHDGETLGQIAKLRLLPDEQLAIAVLTNGIPDGGRAAHALESAVLRDWGVVPPELPAPTPPEPFDPSPFEGCYANLEGTVMVSGSPSGLRLVSLQEASGLPRHEEVTELRPVGEGGAFIAVGGPPPQSLVRFADPDPEGRFQSYFNGRLAWRTGSREALGLGAR
jgi:CubicO group peptidase (beta-lactamase class C family)